MWKARNLTAMHLRLKISIKYDILWSYYIKMMTNCRSPMVTPIFQLISMNTIIMPCHVGGQVVGVAMNKMNVYNLLSGE